MSSKEKSQAEFLAGASDGRTRKTSTRKQRKALEEEELQRQLSDKSEKEKAAAIQQIKNRNREEKFRKLQSFRRTIAMELSTQITDVSPAQEKKESIPKPKTKPPVLTPEKRAEQYAAKVERRRRKQAEIKEELEKKLAIATPEQKAAILEAENEKKRLITEKNKEANRKRRDRLLAAETPEQRLTRLEAIRKRKRDSFERLTPEERAKRSTQLAQKKRQRQEKIKKEQQKILANASPEVKAAILKANEEKIRLDRQKRKENAQRRKDRLLAEETPEQRLKRLELLSQRRKERKRKKKEELQKKLTPELAAAMRAENAEKWRQRSARAKANLEERLAVATPEERESIFAQIKEKQRKRTARKRQARQFPNETPEETKARREARAVQLKKYHRLIKDRQEAGEKSIDVEELRKKLKLPLLTPEVRARRIARYAEWRRQKKAQRNAKFANATPEEKEAILEAEKKELAAIFTRRVERRKQRKTEFLLKLSRANSEEKTILLAEDNEKKRLHCLRTREYHRRSRARKIEREASKDKEARLTVKRAQQTTRRRKETSENAGTRLEESRLETPDQTIARAVKDLQTKIADATPEEKAVIFERKTKKDRRRRTLLLAKETPSEATARRATRANQLQKYIGILRNREVLSFADGSLAPGRVIKEELPYFNQRLTLKHYGEKQKPGNGRKNLIRRQTSTCQQRAQESEPNPIATTENCEELKPQVTSDQADRGQQNPTEVTIIKEEQNQDTWSYFEASHNYLTQETFQSRDITSIEDGSEGIGSSIDGLDASCSNVGTLEDFAGPSTMRGSAINDTSLGQNPLGYLQSAIKTENEADEHTIYGEYIANKFRTCNRDESEAFVAKQLIDNILTNLFSGAYKVLSSAVVAPESISTDIPPVLSDALKTEPE